MSQKIISSCTVILVTFLFALDVSAQTASGLMEGNWLCEVEHSDPVFFALEADDKAHMRSTNEGKPVGKNIATGVWVIDDEDVNDDGQSVVTLIVKWGRGDQLATTVDQTVVATILNDDKMEIRWAEEPMRIWNRVKNKEDNQDRNDR